MAPTAQNPDKTIEPLTGGWPHQGNLRFTYDGTSEWIATLRGMDGTPAGARTRQLVATVFGRLRGHGVKRRIIASNPTKDALGRADYVPSSKRTKKHTYLTMPQLLSVAKAAGEYELMILLAGMCGLRWGEIAALTAAQVQLGPKPMLHVAKAYSEVSGQVILGDTKGGRSSARTNPCLIAARLETAVGGLAPEERVFSSARGAVLRNSKFAQTVYKPAIAEAAAGDEEFPSPTFHDLCHTAVSLAISSGSKVKVVQRIAGHASATLTLDTYAGLFDDDLHDSADRLNERLKTLGWR